MPELLEPLVLLEDVADAFGVGELLETGLGEGLALGELLAVGCPDGVGVG